MAKIVYCATDQIVPGTKGGSTHVLAVAEGLAALGNEVHVAAQPGAGGFPSDASSGVQWHAIGAPLGKPTLRLMRTFAVDRLIRQVLPDIIIERYHNFGGESLRSQGWHVLEVNAPIVDYPGSPKQRLDRALLVEPFRRWRDWQCRRADRFIVPTRAILPDWIPPEKIHVTEWGVDTTRFRPGAQPPPAVKLPFTRDGRLIVIFIGAFRAWHGVRHLVRAMAQLRERDAAAGERIHAVLIGDGPEREPAEAEARAAGLDASITFTGALPHDVLPACLAAAHIGVAPFDTAAHAPLTMAFYWSPLKVFEYMAAGLPVVAPDIPRLRQILGAGEAGLLYDAANPRGLADAIAALAQAGPARRAALGAAARRRAEREYSWMSHCERLIHAVTPPRPPSRSHQ
jgi:glycosyltransferase involved in cell wall biosynthesis